jgi:26S proteasome regulatory subunit T3
LFIIVSLSLSLCFCFVVISRTDKLSGADISAICQEAGMLAIRKNRYVILQKDFEQAYQANVKKSDNDFEFYK